jgi:putative protease
MHASDPTPELLSPAGNWDCARAAVAAGADAIYFGLPKFNARLRADNFIEADLEELMEFLHRHGVKGFVTMNTLIFTSEMKAAEEQLRKIAAAGVDALIIQDLGLAKLAREVAPTVELHASTQMTITSPEGLAFIETLFPLERAVLARELSIKEIERFHAHNTAHLNLKTPLEVFVHGALCVAYSGQCLTSESLGQRSANRGECAQACRMPYEIVVDGETRDLGAVRYLLSPQDLAAVDLVPDLVRAGVKSFKIEGRLKSPEYVSAVTRVYRKALDAAISSSTIPNPQSPITSADRYELEMTFSRGLSTGWFAGINHPYLTHGKFGKKRGPLLGTIIDCGPGWIKLGELTGVPFTAGDGVVFDAGENRDLEQGARIWVIEGERLIFHLTYSGINFDRIKPGQTLYKTSDPKLDSELRRFWQNTRPAEKKSPLHLIVTGKPGEPLEIRSGETSVRRGNPRRPTRPPRRIVVRTRFPRQPVRRKLPHRCLRLEPTPPCLGQTTGNRRLHQAAARQNHHHLSGPPSRNSNLRAPCSGIIRPLPHPRPTHRRHRMRRGNYLLRFRRPPPLQRRRRPLPL